MAHRPTLGKGLASLFPNNTPQMAALVQPVEAHSPTVNPASSIWHTVVSLDLIKANPFQPRREFVDKTIDELAQSIRANGVIQPLVVRKVNDGYELIAGERRMRAAKLAQLKEVPIVIKKSTDRESLEMALIENIQRENLNCVDEAQAYQQLMEEFSLTQEEVSTRVGKDRASVANFLRILRLPELILMDLKTGVLSFGHGKTLLSVEDNTQRLKVRAEIVDKKLSVRDTERYIEQLKNSHSFDNESKKHSLDPVKQRLANLSQEITRKWATKIEMKGNSKRGKILVHYNSREELERILQIMQSSKA